MSTAEKFQDWGVWNKAREISKKIYFYTKREGFNKDYALVRQINAASGSVMDNIAEGFERGGNKEFLQFLFVAKGSAGEVLSQVFRAFDREHITAGELEELKSHLEHLSNMIGKLISYLKTTELKGKKFSNPGPNSEH